jgi:hypothetical protein
MTAWTGVNNSKLKLCCLAHPSDRRLDGLRSIYFVNAKRKVFVMYNELNSCYPAQSLCLYRESNHVWNSSADFVLYMVKCKWFITPDTSQANNRVYGNLRNKHARVTVVRFAFWQVWISRPAMHINTQPHRSFTTWRTLGKIASITMATKVRGKDFVVQIII